ncbi:MAG: TIGR01777 family oxidoreductase, partial [Leptospira sp.]|nr:TIGR01777 family oxidoreductase [Leptospira sp.]
MAKKIGIIGGSGMIGVALAEELVLRGEDVFIFSRQKKLPVEIAGNPGIRLISYNKLAAGLLEGFDVLINFAGEPVVGRWTDDKKRMLETSRVDFTKYLVSELLKVNHKPALFIQGSAIGIYGFQEDSGIHFTESSGSGSDFLALLCMKWESAIGPLRFSGIRVDIIRTGVVLSCSGGAFQKMLPAFRMMAGGPIGSGKQVMSWIHIRDMVSGIIFLIENGRNSDIYNFTAPNPVTNEEFTKSLAMALGRPAPFRVPEFAMKLLFGEGSDVVTKGQFVLPVNLQKSGYQFEF